MKSKINRKTRDLENERQNLLVLIETMVPPEIRQKIEQAISLVPQSQHIVIKISHVGACDAIDK